jgi:hypothetical protein
LVFLPGIFQDAALRVMNRIVRKIVFAVLLLPILLIVGAFFLPGRFHVERSLTIKASPADIFPYLNELRRWPEWTSWTTNREPSLVYQQSGPAAGVGATQSWTARSGNGSIRLTSSDPADGVGYELNFNEGRFVSQGRLRLLPVPEGTRVVWTTDGDLGRNPVGRYLGLLMDRMMGADFEIGLQNLKTKLEPAPAPTAAPPPAPAP